jgi:hypothetical protein
VLNDESKAELLTELMKESDELPAILAPSVKPIKARRTR